MTKISKVNDYRGKFLRFGENLYCFDKDSLFKYELTLIHSRRIAHRVCNVFPSQKMVPHQVCKDIALQLSVSMEKTEVGIRLV